ncbi:MAG: hypothetical protein PHY82_10835, partial [Lentisphaeria bacterium]|nr:hypothetical protein [Lentisphaeria bacterium]
FLKSGATAPVVMSFYAPNPNRSRLLLHDAAKASQTLISTIGKPNTKFSQAVPSANATNY